VLVFLGSSALLIKKLYPDYTNGNMTDS